MGKKIIRLTENDIKNIVLKILSEQNQMDVDDNPLAKIQPSRFKSPQRMGSPNVDGMLNNDGPLDNDIVQKKIAVRVGLKKLVYLINDLITSSGINPETNNLVSDIEKVQDKFENLWGDPTPENEQGDE